MLLFTKRDHPSPIIEFAGYGNHPFNCFLYPVLQAEASRVARSVPARTSDNRSPVYVLMCKVHCCSVVDYLVCGLTITTVVSIINVSRGVNIKLRIVIVPTIALLHTQHVLGFEAVSPLFRLFSCIFFISPYFPFVSFVFPSFLSSQFPTSPPSYLSVLSHIAVHCVSSRVSIGCLSRFPVDVVYLMVYVCVRNVIICTSVLLF